MTSKEKLYSYKRRTKISGKKQSYFYDVVQDGRGRIKKGFWMTWEWVNDDTLLILVAYTVDGDYETGWRDKVKLLTQTWAEDGHPPQSVDTTDHVRGWKYTVHYCKPCLQDIGWAASLQIHTAPSYRLWHCGTPMTVYFPLPRSTQNVMHICNTISVTYD